MASSLASTPVGPTAGAPSVAEGWVRGLSRLFRRVALFRIDGTDAELVAHLGLGRVSSRLRLSLHEPSPLRSALLAASPVIAPGQSEEARSLLASLGIAAPRAYAIIPLVTGGRLVALAYGDRAGEPLPLAQVAALFDYLTRLLDPESARLNTRSSVSTGRRRRARRTRPLALRRRVAPEPIPPPLPQPPPPRVEPMPRVEAVPLALAEYAPPPELEAAIDVDLLADSGAFSTQAFDVVVTPQGSLSLGRHGALRTLALLLMLTVGLAAFGAALLSFAPPRSDAVGLELVTIAPESSVASIATELEERGIIRSARAFRLLARLSGEDRALRAGAYHLSPAAWLWTVLGELETGQVESLSFTIPEGLRLEEIAAVLSTAGLGSKDEFLLAARDPQLLARYGIPATSVEGYLFPETYTVARGLSPRAILEVMLQQFFERFSALPGASELSPRERHRALTLASIVEREAKVKDERRRIAGVFQNRLTRHMKLESCATVQYVLGEPKERLLLSDVRTESPYNTYLEHDLPPGPIASPGLEAIRAALSPEPHDYLFFFARPDGSGRHVFSRTYAEHQQAQRRLGRG